MNSEFQAEGSNEAALFTLKIHRGEGMALVAMNWKDGEPPADFVGFAIEYQEPGGKKFFPLKNRLSFGTEAGDVNPNRLSTLQSPIQKFRWVHFPRNSDLVGEFRYRITPVFMNESDELSSGEVQEASIALGGETYPGRLNVTFTRGFVASQAFVDRYEEHGPISDLLPAKAAEGLDFVPTHPKAEEALGWMGFEARRAILGLLDEAIADPGARVYVVAYDLSEAAFVSRLEKLGPRLRIIIDDSGDHGEPESGESQSAERLVASAGEDNVKRDHVGGLQHNKTIVVDAPTVRAVVCGSTNYSWRGFYVQSNNALILRGDDVTEQFKAAFENYWQHVGASAFSKCPSAKWLKLEVPDVDIQVGFSPYSKKNAALASIAGEIQENTTSSLLYSLAFLYQTPGVIRDAITSLTDRDDIFIYGISDKKVGGFELQKPGGNLAPVSPAALAKNVPEPFKTEPKGGGGNRMHHKFLVIDFDKPTARVYLGSYNFSVAADSKNGENLVLIKDRRVAASYMVEALRIFDHYHFRVVQDEAKKARKKLSLKKPPREAGEKAWWADAYSDPRKIRDREIFA